MRTPLSPTTRRGLGSLPLQHSAVALGSLFRPPGAAAGCGCNTWTNQLAASLATGSPAQPEQQSSCGSCSSVTSSAAHAQVCRCTATAPVAVAQRAAPVPAPGQDLPLRIDRQAVAAAAHLHGQWWEQLIVDNQVASRAQATVTSPRDNHAGASRQGMPSLRSWGPLMQ